MSIRRTSTFMMLCCSGRIFDGTLLFDPFPPLTRVEELTKSNNMFLNRTATKAEVVEATCPITDDGLEQLYAPSTKMRSTESLPGTEVLKTQWRNCLNVTTSWRVIKLALPTTCVWRFETLVDEQTQNVFLYRFLGELSRFGDKKIELLNAAFFGLSYALRSGMDVAQSYVGSIDDRPSEEAKEYRQKYGHMDLDGELVDRGRKDFVV